MNEAISNGSRNAEFETKVLSASKVEVLITPASKRGQGPAADTARVSVLYRVEGDPKGGKESTFVTMPDPGLAFKGDLDDSEAQKVVEYLIPRTERNQESSTDNAIEYAARSLGLTVPQLIQGATIARNALLDWQAKQ